MMTVSGKINAWADPAWADQIVESVETLGFQTANHRTDMVKNFAAASGDIEIVRFDVIYPAGRLSQAIQAVRTAVKLAEQGVALYG